MFRHHILGMLRGGVPKHGYRLAKEYAERTGTTPQIGSMYRELHRLEMAKLVAVITGRSVADPRRICYRITEQGADAFDRWLHTTAPAWGDRAGEIEARAALLSETEPRIAQEVVARWREDLSLRSRELERSLGQALAEGDAATPLAILLKRQLRHVAADRVFVDELSDHLRSPRQAGAGFASPGDEMQPKRISEIL
jgi:DNA-binding PadR family transcriptional regulator